MHYPAPACTFYRKDFVRRPLGRLTSEICGAFADANANEQNEKRFGRAWEDMTEAINKDTMR